MELRKKKSQCVTIEDALLCPEARTTQHLLSTDVDDDYDSDIEVRDVDDDEFDSSGSDEEIPTEGMEFDFEMDDGIGGASGSGAHDEQDFNFEI
jgi:hypothetical protein